jgi:hypothetical protein
MPHDELTSQGTLLRRVFSQGNDFWLCRRDREMIRSSSTIMLFVIAVALASGCATRIGSHLGIAGGCGCGVAPGCGCGCEPGCAVEPGCACEPGCAADCGAACGPCGRSFAGQVWKGCGPCQGPKICVCKGPECCGCEPGCAAEPGCAFEPGCACEPSCGCGSGVAARHCGPLWGVRYAVRSILSPLTACGGCDGELYWSEWHNDPPYCCDPCDKCGNYIGPSPNYGSGYAGEFGTSYGDGFSVGHQVHEQQVARQPAATTQPTMRR